MYLKEEGCEVVEWTKVAEDRVYCVVEVL